MNINEFKKFIKTEKAAYMSLAIGILLPALTYPITDLSSNGFLKQMLFAKKGVFYEPTITEYSLSVFGWFYIPFGIILSTGIALLSIGIVRLLYLKKNT